MRTNSHFFNLDQITKKRNIYIMLCLIISSIIFSESATAIYCGELQKSGFDAIGAVYPDCGGACTGTLIQGDWVLTAAHCFDGCPGNKAKFEIIKNDSNISKNYSFSVDKIVLHPDYEESRRDAKYDLALIRLNKNISQELKIEPIPTAIYGEPDYLTLVGFGAISENCDISGLGNKHQCTFCKFLDEVKITYLRSCDNKSAGICFYDSGGPALDNNTKVVGIISRDEMPGTSITEIDEDEYEWIQKETSHGQRSTQEKDNIIEANPINTSETAAQEKSPLAPGTALAALIVAAFLGKQRR